MLNFFKKDQKKQSDKKKKKSGDWFEDLFGFRERSRDDVLENLYIESEEEIVLSSRVNNQSYRIGRFELPSLGELRTRRELVSREGSIGMSVVMGDVADLQAAKENRYATFQVASQFNCLEFPSPNRTPENGVTCYVYDKTQGPACSISCGPATVYRNYFVPMEGDDEKEGQIGQTKERQINNLHEVLEEMAQKSGIRFLEVKNGYTVNSDNDAFLQMLSYMENLDEDRIDVLRSLLRVGVQYDTQVTSSNWGNNRVKSADQLITQVFCSGCSISYTRTDNRDWEHFAPMILQSCYESVLHVALETAERHNYENGSNRVFLTLVGAGVFGNPPVWVVNAISRACMKFSDCDLDIRIVQYNMIGLEVRELVDSWND